MTISLSSRRSKLLKYRKKYCEVNIKAVKVSISDYQCYYEYYDYYYYHCQCSARSKSWIGASSPLKSHSTRYLRPGALFSLTGAHQAWKSQRLVPRRRRPAEGGGMLERRGQMEVEMSEETLSVIALENFWRHFRCVCCLGTCARRTTRPLYWSLVNSSLVSRDWLFKRHVFFSSFFLNAYIYTYSI